MCDYGVVTMPRRIYIVFLEVQVGLLWRFSWGPTQDLCSKGQQGSPSGGWPSGHSGHSVLCLGSSRPINLDDSGPTGLGNLVSLTQEARDQWYQVVPRVAQALGALPLGGAGQLPPDTQSTGFSAGWDCAGCSWLAGSDRSQLTCLGPGWSILWWGLRPGNLWKGPGSSVGLFSDWQRKHSVFKQNCLWLAWC